jgi:hypothetical protein
MKLAATAIALLLALTAEAAGKSQRPSVLGIVWYGATTEIVKLDALSLKPISRRARLDEPSWFIARSPARQRAVFTVGNSQARLRFLDVRRMRFAGGVGIGHVQGWLWRDAHRLVLVAGGEQPSVYLVDPLTREARLVRTLDGSVTAVTRSATWLVALLTPKDHIGPARLAVIDGDANVREVALPGVRAGWEVVDPTSHRSRQEVPGLAIDAARSRIIVVTAAGSVAEVNLDTLRFTLHTTKARTLARRQKALEGWIRSAAWFGRDLVAVTGNDFLLEGASVRVTPAGVTLIDTRDWSTRTMEPLARYAVVTGNTLLVCGAGLSGYGLDGTKRFHLFGQQDVPYVQILAGYVYLAAKNNTRYTILDPYLGGVLKRVSTPNITTLADG